MVDSPLTQMSDGLSEMYMLQISSMSRCTWGTTVEDDIHVLMFECPTSEEGNKFEKQAIRVVSRHTIVPNRRRNTVPSWPLLLQ
jgi:hypothetical protein